MWQSLSWSKNIPSCPGNRRFIPCPEEPATGLPRLRSFLPLSYLLKIYFVTRWATVSSTHPHANYPSSCLLQECPTGMVDEESFKNIFSQFFPQGGEYVKRAAANRGRTAPMLCVCCKQEAWLSVTAVWLLLNRQTLLLYYRISRKFPCSSSFLYDVSVV
jgi:hypothetical protein